MAERGFITLTFDPSYTGESKGEPRYVAAPDINTENFQAAVDFLSVQDNVDPEKIGIICFANFLQIFHNCHVEIIKKYVIITA